ncbi:MAG: SRPBCC family protein [Candidatus Aminicenantes bacterium]|nr:SRPBCC family protein [Candidatus Aminicenantes bacterium]
MLNPLRIHELHSSVTLPAPIDRVFAFFSRAENLDDITPPWLHFRITTPPPISMAEGNLIDYRIKLYSVPIRWRSKITEWNPPHSFTDEQISGPYMAWKHHHFFNKTEGGTEVKDHVRYAVPGFVFEPIIQWVFVKNHLDKIFAYRRQKLLTLFP